MNQYKVKATTDDKFIGKEVEFAGIPLVIGDFEFYYEKVVVSGDDLIISNSNYVIQLRKING